MWRTRTWATVAAIAVAVMTATAGFAWAEPPPNTSPLDNPRPAGPSEQARVAIDTEPRAAEAWAENPVWVASTVARIEDISADGKRFLLSDGSKFGCFNRATGKTDWMIDNSTIHSARLRRMAARSSRANGKTA